MMVFLLAFPLKKSSTYTPMCNGDALCSNHGCALWRLFQEDGHPTFFWELPWLVERGYQIDETIRQPTSKPANQPTNQPTNQSINHKANHANTQPVTQPTQSTNGPIIIFPKQQINQLATYSHCGLFVGALGLRPDSGRRIKWMPSRRTCQWVQAYGGRCWTIPGTTC